MALLFIILSIRKILQGFYFSEISHMGSLVKIESLRIGEITMSFTDVGKSCPSD